VIDSHLAQHCTTNGAAVILKEAQLHFGYVEEIFQMCCKFPSAGPAPNDDNLKQTMHSAPKADLSKDHMNWAHLCSLNEWIINFVLFFFKLVLDSQRFDTAEEDEAGLEDIEASAQEDPSQAAQESFQLENNSEVISTEIKSEAPVEDQTVVQQAPVLPLSTAAEAGMDVESAAAAAGAVKTEIKAEDASNGNASTNPPANTANTAGTAKLINDRFVPCPVMDWTTDVRFLEQVKSLFKQCIKIQGHDTDTCVTKDERKALWEILDGLCINAKSEQNDLDKQQQAVGMIQGRFPKRAVHAWGELHQACAARLGVIPPNLDAAAVLASCMTNATSSVRPLGSLLQSADVEAVQFDTLSFTTISKDPVRQCSRCQRVTTEKDGVPTEKMHPSEQAWLGAWKYACPVCGAGWRTLLPVETVE